MPARTAAAVETYYKYDRHVPSSLVDELKEAADVASRLDEQMERLHREVTSSRSDRGSEPGWLSDASNPALPLRRR